MDCSEALPLDVQRYITQLREYDVIHRLKINQIGKYLKEYKKENNDASTKRKYLNKIQKALIKSQQYGDEKLNLVSQIVEMIENRTQMVSKYANEMNNSNLPKDETALKPNSSTATNNTIPPKLKLEKPKVISNNEKTTKNIYEKPKRSRRSRNHEKHSEKNERNHNSSFRNVVKDEDIEEEDEDEVMDGEEESDNVRNKKDLRKNKEKEVKVKEKVKEEREERKDEKKIEKRETKPIAKVVKKSGKVSNKFKKKKKKDKEEAAIEEMAVDPDEPTYCVCNSISYGDMIGCDNDDCEIEWFHFGCVNLTHKPKGKWYCPGCSAERKDSKKK